MKFREFGINSGVKIFLGKNAENNDELMKSFKGKENVILHTSAPGSPFCVIGKLNPSKEEIYESGIITAKYSQDWRNHKKDVEIHVFTGKEVSKPWFSKIGTWKVKNFKKLKVKKSDILMFERQLNKNTQKNDTRPNTARKK